MKTNRFQTRCRRVVALLVVGLVLGLATSASALSRDDIYNLLNSGLQPDVIVSVIRSSTAPITVTEAEVLQMRSEGVPEPILEEICSRIGCAAMAPGPGVAPVGPSLDQERERQRQEDERRRQEEAQRLEMERERMRENIAREQARAGQPVAGHQELARGEQQFRARNYLQSAMAFNAYLDSVQPASGSTDHYEATFGYVRALHAAGARHIIRREALELVLQGPNRPHFEAAFAILDDIVRTTEYRSPQIEDLTGVPVQNQEMAFQDRWNFFLGRYFWAAGDVDRALQFFGRISENAPSRARAHYLSATILLDRRENTRAIREMQEAVRAAMRTSDQDVFELAYLALARVNYELGNLDAALFYYNRVPATSARWGRVLFESAWTHYLREDFNRSIGSLHGLHSPYLNHWFWPDLFVLEAASYLATCNLDEAELAIEMFDRIVPAVQAPVRRFIAETADPNAFWSAIADWHDRARSPEPVPLPIEAVRYVLQRPGFKATLDAIRAIEAELDAVRAGAATLGELGDYFADELEANLLNRRIEGGLRVSADLVAFSDELTDWTERAREVQIELTNELIQRTRATREGQVVRGAGATAAFVLARDWQTWPFEGEYWLDEIGSFRADLVQFRDRDTDTCLLPFEEE